MRIYYFIGILSLLFACKQEENKITNKVEKPKYQIQKIPFISSWKIDSTHLGEFYFPEGNHWIYENQNYYLDTLEMNLSSQFIAKGDFRKDYQLILEKLKTSYQKDSLLYKNIQFDSVVERQGDPGIKIVELKGNYSKNDYTIKDLIFLSETGAEAIFSSIVTRNKSYQDSVLFEIENAYRLK